ncbi:sugar O-acetyltransferase [Ferrimonas marina]|uniref:Acetyltransferase n=1 Tax=Ferrimonas marina TaxID=299255 RepID=A0A1M5RYD0_9GAMM|nr:sugar O-acetyltransferase [Ferrimonas marina]SHH31210.1 maltose O-acetyltransferase [Ferrimonas marina]
MSEQWQKMVSGQNYQPWDAELTAKRQQAKVICHRFNQTCPSEESQRRALLAQLLGQESDAHIEAPFHCDYGSNLKLGKRFYANHGCTLLDPAAIVIGDDVLLAPGVVIATATHPIDPERRAAGEESAQAITIGNRVWLGANVSVCPGVTIGDNVVVGAGSVVTRDLPANTVCAGNPARVIRPVE